MPTTPTTYLPFITKQASRELADLAERYGEQVTHLARIYREMRQMSDHANAIAALTELLDEAANERADADVHESWARGDLINGGAR